MDNDSIKRLLEEQEIGLHEVVFLVALPTTKETFERMNPPGSWLKRMISKKRDFFIDTGFNWKTYDKKVVQNVMPILADLYLETGVNALTDLTYGRFETESLNEKYKLVILAAHHSKDKGKTEFLDGLISDKKLMGMLKKNKTAKVFDLCRFESTAVPFKKNKTYRSHGPVAYANWDIPVTEGLYFLALWVKCLKTHPKLSNAYDEAIRLVIKKLGHH